MRKKTKLNLLLATGAFLVATIATLVALREPMQPLTHEALEAARTRWEQQGIKSYRMKFKMHGSTYEVSVKADGQVTVLVNGQPPIGGNTAPFVMEGLFDTLATELDNLESPTGPFAGRQGTVLMRVRFNPRLGYIERYLRSAGGYGNGVSFQMEDFKVTD